MMVDSKDAKAKVFCDGAPVQKPGKTWKKRDGILPDHDWGQLQKTSLTPMTHLFVETKVEKSSAENMSHNPTVLRYKRTSKACSLINLSFFEPETVFRGINEFFLILVEPSLDSHFRNPNTGKLKEHFVFIVDNGPSGKPSNPTLQMLLVRLCRFLKIKTCTQQSFAEYHSKLNPVERVHATQNRELSKERFSSKKVHPYFFDGDSRHLENMESVAEDVRACLARVEYGGQPCTSLRGIGNKQSFVFSDEEELKSFLSLSELGKSECEDRYTLNKKSE